MGLFSGNKEINMTPSQLVSLLEYDLNKDFTVREIDSSMKKKVKNIFDRVFSGKPLVNIVKSSDDLSKAVKTELFREYEVERWYSAMAEVDIGGKYNSKDLLEKIRDIKDMKMMALSKETNPENYRIREREMEIKYFKKLN